MPSFDLAYVLEQYQPSGPLDCDKNQYAARVKVCAGCEHRNGNLCSLDNHLLSVRARRKTSACLADLYPDQKRPNVRPAEPQPSFLSVAANWFRSVGKSLGLIAAPPVPLPEPVPLRPVRVAFMTPSLEAGGAERWILSLCRWLQAEVLGVVSTSTAAHPGMLQAMQRVGAEVIKFPEAAERAREVLQQADVILVWGIGDLAPYLEGIDTAVVWVSHGACHWTTRLVYGARPRVKHWVGVSETSLRVFPVAIQPTATVIHNGVDIERTTPVHGRAAARRKLGIRDDQIVVGYLGRFSPEKRPAAVAEAVACLPSNYVALMVGDGWKDAETRAAANRAAPGRVIFAGHQEHVGDMLAAFDVWLNASPSEGMCLSLLEAWLAGVPCISTPTGALPELEREAGQLVGLIGIGADGPAIAAEIRALLETGSAGPITERARKLAWEKFTAPAMAARWDAYLDRICAGRRP